MGAFSGIYKRMIDEEQKSLVKDFSKEQLLYAAAETLKSKSKKELVEMLWDEHARSDQRNPETTESVNKFIKKSWRSKND